MSFLLLSSGYTHLLVIRAELRRNQEKGGVFTVLSMPMALRLKTYTTSAGKRRVIRLYGAWKNMLARTRGTGKAGNGANYWVGKEVGWADFDEFREWAIAHGYSRTLCSLDRRNHLVGYTPANCQWLTREANTIRENESGWMQPGDPENHPFCPF